VARIVVIGASQGGILALHKLIGGLPETFSAPILIVQHIGPSQSMLPSILNDLGGTRAAFGTQGEMLREGRIYVAPPDHHMLLTDGHLKLTHGPRENWARPAIDPLFRTAAYHYGPDVIGIVLSGGLNDGTAGLYEIKRRGGIAIVQTPAEAETPDMPNSALENVAVDYCLRVAEMPRLLLRLVQEPSEQTSLPVRGRTAMNQETFAEPTTQTCPECGGAMREENVGSLVRFRCPIGHVMTTDVLAITQLERLKENLSAVLRGLNERAALCREIAQNQEAKGNHAAAEIWLEAADEAERRERLTRALVDKGWVHPEAAAETLVGEARPA